ncbi:MAG: DUF362 domain-containing protein, partial [Thermodesulfobacteriota bacterium]
MEKENVYVCDFDNRHDSIATLLDCAGLIDKIPTAKQVMIKPNLVENLKPPITTPVQLVEEIIRYLHENAPHVTVVIGEGTGSRAYDTFHPFKELGYVEMADRLGVELIDLNVQPLRTMQLPNCQRWPEMHLPEIIFDSFL